VPKCTRPNLDIKHQEARQRLKIGARPSRLLSGTSGAIGHGPVDRRTCVADDPSGCDGGAPILTIFRRLASFLC